MSACGARHGSPPSPPAGGGGGGGGGGKLARPWVADSLGGSEYAFPLAGGAGADVAGQPRHVGMHGLRADNDLHHQKPGNFLLTLHFRDTFQELLVMPLVQVEQVRMEAVFAGIVLDETIEKTEHEFLHPGRMRRPYAP